MYEGIVQMPLAHWQAWGINQVSRKPVPVFEHSPSAEMSPSVRSQLPLYGIPTHPVSYEGEKRLSPPSLLPLLQKFSRAMRLPLSLLFFRLDNPSVLRLSSQDISSSPLTSFGVPSACFQVHVFLLFWSPELYMWFKGRQHQCSL